MTEPYRDARRPTEERVADLLDRMTLEEKAAQLTSVWVSLDPEKGEVAPSNFSFGLGRAEDPWQQMAHGIGQVTRPLGSQPIDPADGARMVNMIQRRLIGETRLGIPAIMHEECLTGPMFQGATSFASPLNFASTWDPELIGRVGDVIRRQMRAVGAHQGLAPVADVARDARWGRVEETLGEDPYLVGRMVTEYVRGLQGPDLTSGIVATLKHFAGYSSSEGGRNFAPAHMGPRELADVFLVPFEMAVRDGGAKSVMNSYAEVDGEAPAASRRLLTEILREQWGFDGIVVADYGAVSFLYIFHHVAADSVDAAALALRAGLDVELPNPADFPTGIPAAIERGLLEPAVVDEAVRRVLRLKFELGLFEAPFVDEAAVPARLDTDADRALAAEVARASITLLANDGTLPLDPAACGRVAVIGPNADAVMALFGNYSFENHIVSTHFPDRTDVVVAPTVLDALGDRLGADRVTYAQGCTVAGRDSGDGEDIAAAVTAAADADVAVVVLGDKAGHFGTGTVGEGTDTIDLGLPGRQQELLDALLATGTPTVVVLLNGRVFALPGLAGRAAAIVEAWFPGQDGAAAIADVLFGDVDPAGRTPVTFSAGAGAMPLFYNQKRLGRGFPDVPGTDPVFPFGHGLSYTTFYYGPLTVAAAEVPIGGEIVATATVTNVGPRTGTEVVQLYLRDPVASVTQPVRQLKGFTKVTLEPEATATVTFTLPTDLCSFTGPDLVRIVEPGAIELEVGASSGDIRSTAAVSLTGAVTATGRRRALQSRVEVVVA